MPKTKKTAKKPSKAAKKAAKPPKKVASVKVRDLSLESGKKASKAADVRGGDGTVGPLPTPGTDLQLGRTAVRDLGGDRSTGIATTRVVDDRLTTQVATSTAGGAYPTPVFSR